MPVRLVHSFSWVGGKVGTLFSLTNFDKISCRVCRPSRLVTGITCGQTQSKTFTALHNLLAALSSAVDMLQAALSSAGQ